MNLEPAGPPLTKLSSYLRRQRKLEAQLAKALENCNNQQTECGFAPFGNIHTYNPLVTYDMHRYISLFVTMFLYLKNNTC